MATSAATSGRSKPQLSQPSWTLDDALALSQALGEPDWGRQLRRSAWKQYAARPMPSQHEEEWRKTNLSLIHWEGIRPSTLSRAAPAASVEGLPEPARSLVLAEEVRWGGVCLQHDEAQLYRFLGEELAAQGVQLLGLQQAMTDSSDLLQEHLFRLVTPDLHPFAALHTSLMNGGAFLYVPPGVQLDTPVLVGYWHAEAGGHASPHTLVVLGEDSAATVIEVCQSPALRETALASGASEIFVGVGAQCHYVTLQEWDGQMVEVATRRARLQRDARLTWTTVNVGARLSRNDLGVLLQGEGADVQMNGLGFVSGRQHLDQHTLQEHQVGHARSDLLFKVALHERSRSVYRGIIRIHPDAQRSDAYQANRNLLLSPHTKADTMPVLEIEANDVRCTHGASLGKVDAEQRFYLNSRGLSPLEAERILVDAFFSEILDRLPLPLLRKRTGEWIARKLQQSA